MKISYTYEEFKDFPEATMISQDRARAGILLGSLSFIFALLSVILLLSDLNRVFSSFGSFFEALSCILVSVGFCLYMIFIYPKVTEKKIRKAIQDRIQLEYELAHPSYTCKYIKVLGNPTTGKCWKCFRPNVSLTSCKIKTPKETVMFNLCEDCIQKYQSNVTQ